MPPDESKSSSDKFESAIGTLAIVGVIGVLFVGYFHGDLRVWLAQQPFVGSYYAEIQLRGQWETHGRRLSLQLAQRLIRLLYQAGIDAFLVTEEEAELISLE